MDRRRFLETCTATGLGMLSGCLDATGPQTPTPGQTETRSTPADEPGGDVASVAGVDLPIPEEQLDRGSPRDAIPAITAPEFGTDWSGLELSTYNQLRGSEVTIEPRLADVDEVIGVARGSEARAYPLKVLNWHEVVNDRFDGPLLVTYCPLCGTGITAERRVDGQPAVFGVSGLLFRSNLVMYDQPTDSLWGQIAATAIRGPRTGHRLSLTPSTLTTWGDWRDSHPETRVLLPPPASGTITGNDRPRNYTVSPYVGYDGSPRIGTGNNDSTDGRLHPKTRVVGVTSGQQATAYPLPAVTDAGGVVNDTVGDLPVVVATSEERGTFAAYDRRVDSTTLRFEHAGGTTLEGGGSRWNLTTGAALDGPHAGTKLSAVSDAGPSFWFAWAEFNPDTAIYGQ